MTKDHPSFKTTLKKKKKFNHAKQGLPMVRGSFTGVYEGQSLKKKEVLTEECSLVRLACYQDSSCTLYINLNISITPFL